MEIKIKSELLQLIETLPVKEQGEALLLVVKMFQGVDIDINEYGGILAIILRKVYKIVNLSKIRQNSVNKRWNKKCSEQKIEHAEEGEKIKEEKPKVIEEVKSEVIANIDKPKRQPQKIDFVIELGYEEPFNRWLKYKRERKNSYTPTGLKACYKKLVQLSAGSPDLANQIVEQSISNNWLGLFSLKNYGTNKYNERGHVFSDNEMRTIMQLSKQINY